MQKSTSGNFNSFLFLLYDSKAVMFLLHGFSNVIFYSFEQSSN